MGAALQYRMLVQSGLPRATSASALTATNLLVFAVVLALPVLAVPAIAGGAVNHRLIQATLIGVIVFIGLFAVGVAMLALRPPAAGHRAAGPARAQPAAPPVGARCAGLPDRLVAERDRILTTLGRDWKRALAATVGRWALRLRHAAGRAGRRRLEPAPVAGAAGLLRGAGAGPDPGHARRAGLRGGRA